MVFMFVHPVQHPPRQKKQTMAIDWPWYISSIFRIIRYRSSTLMMAPTITQKTHKVPEKPANPTAYKPRKPHHSTHTTAKPLRQPKEDLTLSDWLEVVDYVEDHEKRGLSLRQIDIVNYFATRKSGVQE